MEKKINIIVSGSYMSGKTSLLVLISKLLENEGVKINISSSKHYTHEEIMELAQLDTQIFKDRLKNTRITITESQENREPKP